MFDLQSLTDELLSAVGRPISTYMQPGDEREDGATVVWFWPSECETDEDRRTFAVGFVAREDGFVHAVDVNENTIFSARNVRTLAIWVGVHLTVKAPTVKAPRKSRKAKVVAPVVVTDIAPSAAALVQIAPDAAIAIVETAAGRPVSTCVELRHDNADIIWYWPTGEDFNGNKEDVAVGVSDTRYGIQVLHGNQLVICKSVYDMAEALRLSGRRLSARPVLDAAAPIEDRIMTVMHWLDRPVSTSEMSRLLGVSWPEANIPMGHMGDRIRSVDIDMGWAQGGFYCVAPAAPAPDGGEAVSVVAEDVPVIEAVPVAPGAERDAAPEAAAPTLDTPTPGLKTEFCGYPVATDMDDIELITGGRQRGYGRTSKHGWRYDLFTGDRGKAWLATPDDWQRKARASGVRTLKAKAQAVQVDAENTADVGPAPAAEVSPPVREPVSEIRGFRVVRTVAEAAELSGVKPESILGRIGFASGLDKMSAKKLERLRRGEPVALPGGANRYTDGTWLYTRVGVNGWATGREADWKPTEVYVTSPLPEPIVGLEVPAIEIIEAIMGETLPAGAPLPWTSITGTTVVVGDGKRLEYLAGVTLHDGGHAVLRAGRAADGTPWWSWDVLDGAAIQLIDGQWENYRGQFPEMADILMGFGVDPSEIHEHSGDVDLDDGALLQRRLAVLPADGTPGVAIVELDRGGAASYAVVDADTGWPVCDEGLTTDWGDPARLEYDDPDAAARAAVDVLVVRREEVGETSLAEAIAAVECSPADILALGFISASPHDAPIPWRRILSAERIDDIWRLNLVRAEVELLDGEKAKLAVWRRADATNAWVAAWDDDLCWRGSPAFQDGQWVRVPGQSDISAKALAAYQAEAEADLRRVA